MKETLNELHKRHADKAMAVANTAKKRMDAIQVSAKERLLKLRDEHNAAVIRWWDEFSKEEEGQLFMDRPQ